MPEKNAKNPNKLQISYRQSASYRTFHGSGAFGGITPTGELFVGFYSERPHFPESGEVTFQPSGDNQEELNVRSGVVREMEMGTIMTYDAAKAFSQWLTDRLTQLDRAKAIEIGQGKET